MCKTLVKLSITAFMIAPLCSTAQDRDGWEEFGRALGTDSEDAYFQGVLEGLEREALLAEARTRMHVERIRSQLSMLWQAAGLSVADANALAAAYEPTASEAAVIAGVRRKGAQLARWDIRAALDGLNARIDR